MRKIPSGLYNDDNNPSSDGGSLDLSSSSMITLTATNGVSLGDNYIYDFETSSGVVGSTTPDELITNSMSGVITSETSDLGSGSFR